MHPDTMEFQDSMWIKQSTVSTGVLCPDQRRMPQIGSLIAEATRALVFFVRLPVVIIVSGPVILDLIGGDCPLRSLSHGMLMNCGAELFSLEDFFTAAYACNGHFWRIISILADKLAPGLPQTFLNGMAMTGENSGVSAYMPGVIGSITKISKNDPMGGASQMRDTFVPSGRMGAAGMAFQAFANPIAGTHWIYRMASRIVVQIIQAVQRQRTIASVFWNVVAEGVYDYNELVALRMLNTCGGLSIMAMGSTSPFGKVVYHYCVSGVRMMVGTLRLVTLFTVDIPLMACVCKQSAGQPADWALQHCEAPDRSKAMLRRLVDSTSQCTTVVDALNVSLKTVFDETFGEMYAGARFVGSSIDYLIKVLDPNSAGNCDNYETNPYVMVILPNPIDYFRVCTKTDVCRVRCQQQIEAFERAKPPGVRTTTGTQAVQSLFFPVLNDDVYMPFADTGIVALIELSECPMCLVDGEDRCFIAGGFLISFNVYQYCIPSALGQGVAKAGSWPTDGISGNAFDIQFLRLGTGGWMEIYSVVAIQDQLVQVCARLSCVEFAPGDVDTDVLGFDRLQVVDNVAIFQVRHLDGTRSYVLQSTTTADGLGWTWTLAASTNIWIQDMYHVVTVTNGRLLLVPFDDVPLQSCWWDSSTYTTYSCTQYTGFNRASVPYKTRGKQARVSQSVAENHGILITADSGSHWLEMLSIDLSGTTARGSRSNSMQATVSYTIEKTCSLDSCIGCVNLGVQRLCYSAHQCLIARCIGTMINQIRPLCAMGAVVESNNNLIIAALQGIWLIISDILVQILEASGGIQKPTVIAWPDIVFYGILCSAKDVIASQVSIFTSAINGMVQFSMNIVQAKTSGVVDTKFLATFSLTMTAITNFIFQLAIAPLLAAVAIQKSVVCQTSSLIGVVVGNNQVVFGDPEIQRKSDIGAGNCLSQALMESSQGGNGDTEGGFIAAGSSLITQLGGVALSIPLDSLKHSLDAVFTYILGIITALQDVIATADTTRSMPFPVCCFALPRFPRRSK